MEEFIFHHGLVPIGYSFSFTETLFNQQAHRELQSGTNWHSFFILNQNNNTVDGIIHFHLQNGIAQSPFRAPHGGFDLHTRIKSEIILSFIKFVELQLRKLEVKKILIKLPLRLSDVNEFSTTEQALIGSSFEIARKDEGGILKVTESFDERIHYSKRKQLKKSIRKDFQFSLVGNNELENIYSFLLQCRKEKNYELSMSLSEMNALISVFPDNVLLFNVKDDDKLVAASICIRVRDELLYDFYHDHDAHYDEFSPIVFLVKGIHDYCFANQILFIDLGTAMTGDTVNAGLLEFKLKLGADLAVKYSFEKNCE